MNKKIISITAYVFLGVVFCMLFYNNRQVITDGVVSISPTEIFVGDGYIFTDNNDFNNNVVLDDDINLDFKNNNYVLLKVFYDPCSEYDLNVKDYYFVSKNKLRVNVTYRSKCGGCMGEDLYYLLKVGKDVTDVTLDVKSKVLNNPSCDPNVAYKPLIYLYPEEETNVSIKVSNPQFLTTVYPKYNDGWDVVAYPNGKMIDKNTGRKLYGLYWEGSNHYTSVKEDGFVVKGEDTSKFLEEKLELLGLNEYEAEEFIIYWLPKLEENKYNYIRFETIDEINNYMGLDINPKPDTLIRVLMDYKPLDKPISVKEQVINTSERIGFTVVEWGGSLIK